MALSKLDLAVVAVVAGALVWIEHDHRIFIGTQAAAEVAPTSVCPDSDSVPFSAECIAFINGGVLPDIHARVSAVASAPAVSPDSRGGAELQAPACPPSNENAPYSAACLRFMFGRYWHLNPIERAP